MGPEQLEQLTPVHLVALANHREAVIALDGACDIAAEELAHKWDDPAAHVSYPERNARSQRAPTHARSRSEVRSPRECPI